MPQKTLNELLKELQLYRTEERKLEFLEKALKSASDPALKKAILTLMASLQAQKKWYNTAARSYSAAAELAETFKEKIELLNRAMLLWVKAENYSEAEAMLRAALAFASEKEKPELQQGLLSAYLQQAKQFEAEKRFTKAIGVLSRLLTLKIDEELERSTKLKIAALYDKIGKPIEANRIRSALR